MSIVHRVTGYDKRTERLAYEFKVPEYYVPEMRTMAQVAPEDTEAAGAYPLDSDTAHFLAGQFNFAMAVDRCDWFLSCSQSEGSGALLQTGRCVNLGRCPRFTTGPIRGIDIAEHHGSTPLCGGLAAAEVV